MAPWKSFLIHIIGTATICAVVMKLLPEKHYLAPIIKLICGVIMILSLFTSVPKVHHSETARWMQEIRLDADRAVSFGLDQARAEMQAVIMETAQTYIEDKAHTMGLNLEVQVRVLDSVPKQITLKGAASPSVKLQLENWIKEHFAITGEDLIWME